MAAFAACSVLLASSATLENGSLAAVRQAATDILATIRDRSPGERANAQLAKSKPAPSPERSARALPRTREAQPKAAARKPEPAPFAPSVPPELAEALAPMMTTAAPPVAAEFSPGPPIVPPIGGGGGVVIPGGGGGGGTTPVEPPPPPPAVPEPATWLNLLLGFAALGWALRRGRRRKPAHA